MDSNALRRFQSIGFLLRIAEIFAALLFVCWIFTCLPFAAEFLRRLSSVVSTPLFMFFLGNSIVVALLTTTKSTVFSGGAEADIHHALIRSGDNRVSSSDGDLTGETIFFDDRQMIDAETDSNSNPTAARGEHAATEPEKQMMDTETDLNSNPTAARGDHAATEPENGSVTVTDLANDHPPPPTTKVYKRSKTEISAEQSPEMVSKPTLRRSETEKGRETVESCEEAPFPEDNLTNEEFQKTIEAFIAKQLIFRRRESLAVVIHNHN
ncbi:Uncharacterized protein Rs2_14177 [Raphanus sativus]|uniref:Uncharacterized protein LOC108855229 n=1 Tax=Raphanus sativus TaxID=3726 RepID=A0A6J0NIB4_RAPSA|nr:uncharacterized protein LOC108855229 [Raphanus sativus]KAJ4900226.1 Uncharacterized protein Rs2_14177 [Raphanus sativus]